MLNRSLLFLVFALICFVIAFCLAVDLFTGGNLTAFAMAGSAAFVAAHLP